jgi:hypothetical protein
VTAALRSALSASRALSASVRAASGIMKVISLPVSSIADERQVVSS